MMQLRGLRSYEQEKFEGLFLTNVVPRPMMQLRGLRSYEWEKQEAHLSEM